MQGVVIKVVFRPFMFISFTYSYFYLFYLIVACFGLHQLSSPDIYNIAELSLSLQTGLSICPLFLFFIVYLSYRKTSSDSTFIIYYDDTFKIHTYYDI